MRRVISLPGFGTHASPRALGRDEYLYAFSIVLIVAAYARLLVMQATELWAVSSYRYFPLLLVASSALIAYRASEPRNETTPWNQLLVFLSLAFLASGIALDSPWFASASALIFLATCILRIGGWLMFKRVLVPWLLLALLVRLPFGADLHLLRRFNAWIFSMVAAALDSISVLHVATATQIVVPGAQFESDAEYSLIGLVVSVSLAGLYCSWRQRGLVHTFVVMSWTALLATVGEIARVVALVTATSRGLIAEPSLVVSIALELVVMIAVLWLAWNLDELIAFRLGTLRRRKRKTTGDTVAPISDTARPQVGVVLANDGELTRHEFAPGSRISTGAWSMLAIGLAFAILLVAQTVVAFVPELRHSIGSHRNSAVAAIDKEATP